MKVLCEIPLEVANFEVSQFEWVKKNNASWLFVVEAGKRLRILSIQQEPAQEIQSTALAESRVCTSCCWNRDASLLAIVVDKRQIYFWELTTNTFTHFKTQTGQLGGSVSSAGRKQRTRDIELVAWSKLTDKLVICYGSGQLLLCKFAKNANVSEKFIDNSDSVLKKIVSVVVSEQADLFACFSVISEVLVMSFDGQTKFYVQGDGLNLFNVKFSNPVQELSTRSASTSASSDRPLWLAYQSKSDGLFFKKISSEKTDFQDMKPKLDVLNDKHNDDSRLVNFFWLSSTRLIACFSSGSIFVAQLSVHSKHQVESTNVCLTCDEIFSIGASEQLDSTGDTQEVAAKSSSGELLQRFKAFELIKFSKDDDKGNNKRRQSFALMAATDYKIFYYQLHEKEHQQSVVDGRPSVSFEQVDEVDEVDLSESLKRISLKIERAGWCHDCSMLAVQLTSGHILVYRTRLEYNTVASYGPRTAYLSAVNEITVLNYGLTSEQRHAADQTADTQTGGDAVILKVGLKPSIIAIGPKHLALALNNRVRFYLVKHGKKKHAAQSHFDEQEYATIVTGLKLNSRFVVIQFDDGRLKLQAIDEQTIPGEVESANDERFFPDPARPESISTFTLTEELLVYCTRETTINVFSLREWKLVQTCDHSGSFDGPINKLVANEVGNKFVCLIDPSMARRLALDEVNFYLYDLYSNTVVSMGDSGPFELIYNKQIDETLRLLSISGTHDKSSTHLMPTQVLDAIWDTDGRTLLLVERETVHVLAVLDHTLEREEPTVEYADRASKPTSYTILYASQGIVSYQTSLGRVINAILETHDDELKLSRLELQVSLVIKDTMQSEQPLHDASQRIEVILKAMLKIMYLKLAYLRSILPIYSLPKCHDICEHLMSDEQFNLRPSEEDQKLIDSDEDERRDFRCNSRLIEQLIWKQLAAWAVHCLNLDFGLLVYRKHNLLTHSRLLADILDDLKLNGQDSRQTMKSRLSLLLGCGPELERGSR